MERHLILRVVTRLLVGPILLFALYVQFHGEYGAGGGFQAGVLGSVAFILYGTVFSLSDLRRRVPDWAIHRLMAFGALLYAGTGIVTMVRGGAYLDYDRLGDVPAKAQQLGIIVIELGVGLTVFSVMVAIYYAFAGRPPRIDNDDW